MIKAFPISIVFGISVIIGISNGSIIILRAESGYITPSSRTAWGFFIELIIPKSSNVLN